MNYFTKGTKTMTETKSNFSIPNIMAAIALFMGLYLVFVAPGFFDETMDRLILSKSYKTIDEVKTFVFPAGPASRLWIGVLYSGIEMLAALGLIATSYALYAGKKGAWPMAMMLLSIPAIGNFYIGLGWLENLKEFPPVYTTFMLSLVAFWAVLLLKENDRETKIALFSVFTLLGMIGAQAFTFFPHALRVILKDYEAALLEPESAVLRHTGSLMLIVVILAPIAIWLLAKRKESGWWLALMAGLMIAVASFPAHYIRPASASLVSADSGLDASIFTSAYWIAGAQGVILVVVLLIPFFKKRLFDETDEAGEIK
jgi:hypothetical protein